MEILTFTSKLHQSSSLTTEDRLFLNADERRRSFCRCVSDQGKTIRVSLKRGTILQDGDILLSEPDEAGEVHYITILARPEPVLTVTADSSLALLKAAYHLGNRHVPLEMTEAYLRLSPDPVLHNMLRTMPVTLTEAIAPFYPEAGAYHSHG
ncbi:MAG: urease accessory protein UreE [Cyanobacteria bacterium P01_F01_bin.42]